MSMIRGSRCVRLPAFIDLSGELSDLLNWLCGLALTSVLLITTSCSSRPAVPPISAPIPTPIPTSTPVPTPTPVPDSDNDGLLDPFELQLGTNPFQRDSDVDGLDDGQEVQLGTDPLFPDTDRDGVVDGDDVLPLADAKVRVSILTFIDNTERPLLHGDTNAYFVVLVGNEELVKTPIYQDVQNERIAPIVVDVPITLAESRLAFWRLSTPRSGDFWVGKHYH